MLDTLAIFTALLVFAQIAFFSANLFTSNVLDAVSLVLSSWIFLGFHSNVILLPVIKFFIAHILIYAVYVWFLWYIVLSISNLFSLRQVWTRLLAVSLLCISAIAILSANCCYFPEAFFSKLIRHNLFNNFFIDLHFKIILFMALLIWIFAIFFALINCCFNFYRKIHRVRDGLILSFLICIFLIVKADDFLALPKNLSTAASNKPNIIIIGFDAMRPDFVSLPNKFKTHTVTIDNFIRSSIYFTNAYTPLARTLPSWTSILTAKYPKNSNARGNNTDLSRLQLDQTLAKELQKRGYETFYATDDRRYNNLNEQFGFDHVIGPPTGFNDFFLGSINDFPLSNLLIPTPIGKLLFPYSYANHDVAISFNPDNFLQLIRQSLHQRTNKPIFLAVHFNISGYPFYWMGCKKKLEDSALALYINAVNAADSQFAQMLGILQQNNLLNFAVVVLLSDHGITLGLPNDRVIKKSQYQGSIDSFKKIKISKYYTAPEYSVNMQHDYGVDTSFGYGGDILSLKQNHIVLAFKGYNANFGKPRIIDDRVSALDITPTLLDILRYPSLKMSDGKSLKNLMRKSDNKSALQRAFYFETSFSIPEIETDHISVEQVLKKVIHLYAINPENGQVFFQHAVEHAMNHEKEYAVMQGDWYLASYPASRILKLTFSAGSKPSLLHPQPMFFKSVIIPGYKVLVNLRTGQWTTEWNTPLALQAPLQRLQDKLQAFYANE